jgi:hypothetical protein
MSTQQHILQDLLDCRTDQDIDNCLNRMSPAEVHQAEIALEQRLQELDSEIVTFEGCSVSTHDLTRDELGRYARLGHDEDIQASTESITRHRRRMGERCLCDPPNVIPFPQSRKSSGSAPGGAA